MVEGHGEGSLEGRSAVQVAAHIPCLTGFACPMVEQKVRSSISTHLGFKMGGWDGVPIEKRLGACYETRVCVCAVANPFKLSDIPEKRSLGESARSPSAILFSLTDLPSLGRPIRVGV